MKAAGVVLFALLLVAAATAETWTVSLLPGQRSNVVMYVESSDPDAYKSEIDNNCGEDELDCWQQVYDGQNMYVDHSITLDDGESDSEIGTVTVPTLNGELLRREVEDQGGPTYSGWVDFVFTYPYE
jgi:hypothetical protein